MNLLFGHMMFLKQTGVKAEMVMLGIIHQPGHIYVVMVHLANKRATARRTTLITLAKYIHRIGRRMHPKELLTVDIVAIILTLLRHSDVIIAEVEAEKCMREIQAIEDDPMIGIVSLMVIGDSPRHIIQMIEIIVRVITIKIIVIKMNSLIATTITERIGANDTTTTIKKCIISRDVFPS